MNTFKQHNLFGSMILFLVLSFVACELHPRPHKFFLNYIYMYILLCILDVELTHPIITIIFLLLNLAR